MVTIVTTVVTTVTMVTTISKNRGPDAVAEDATAEDATAEDATAELSHLGWTLRRSHQILTLPWTLRRVGVRVRVLRVRG